MACAPSAVDLRRLWKGRVDMDRRNDTGLLDSLTTDSAPEPLAAPAPRATHIPDAGCPFQSIMSRLAETAVLQQVLHMEGELLPRTELALALEGWQQLYHLARTRVCPATRDASLTPTEITALVEVALPRLLPVDVPLGLQARLRRQFLVCATCASSQQCPLGLTSRSALSEEG